MTTWLHNWFWIQQDYLWFLAGIGWLAVGAVWWQQRNTGHLPGWIPWSAGAGIATAVTQILILATPVVHLLPNQAPSLRGDMCQGFILSVTAAGWWIAGLRRVRGGLVVGGVVGLLALLAAAWRYDNPTEGIVVIFVALFGAGVWWTTVNRDENDGWNAALALVVLAHLVDTISPLATATVGEQRWYDFSPYSPWAAMVHCIATVTVLARSTRRTEVSPDEVGGRIHWRSVSSATIWLVVGLLFALTVGTWGRLDFENSALGRVRAAAALLSKDAVEELLNERFQIDNVEWVEFPNGARIPAAYSEHAQNHAAPLSAEIWTITQANPDARWVTVSCLRGEWLTSAIVGRQTQKRPGTLTLLRLADDADRLAWESKQAGIIGPRPSNIGDMVVARAPILNRANETVGWLDFHFTASQWVAAQARPRTLAYLIIALGLVIGRQQVVQRLRARERDVAQADALAATQASQLKTTFLANVSHELRTPLQSILGYTDLLLPNLALRDRERLLAVRENADLMGRLVNDLIDLSAAESGKFHLIERPVVLMDLVVQAVESVRHRAEAKGLALSVEVSPEIPVFVYADPQRVRQVVLNLVGNAIKYTDIGRVEIVLALAGRDQATAEIELRVSDTGPGIAKSAQARLFEPFHRLEPTREREGTGLGLAIVAAICRAMGGAARVESDGRSGSTFTARWRLRLGTHAGTSVGPSGKLPLHGRKVLVTDDNALVRDLFVSYLTECGALCATAADGLEAIRRLHTEDYDAVILDLAMPKLDGLATVRRIRAEMPEKQWRIIGVSAHAGVAERDAALAAGMDEFLVKPVVLPELARALAPASAWTPPSRSFEPVRAHFAHRFRAEAPNQSAAVSRALAGGRWPEIHAAAHYLKNSADVVGDEALARACSELEAAARARDRKAGDEAWKHCRLALARWLSEVDAN